MEELERVYMVPLGKAYDKPRLKRARVAIKILRSFVSRHMKVDESSVKFSSATNHAIWYSGIKKPPRKIKITAKRTKEGMVNVHLVGEKEAEAKAAEKKKKKQESKKKAKPAEKKEDKPAEKPVKKEEKKKPAEKKASPKKNNKKAAPKQDKKEGF